MSIHKDIQPTVVCKTTGLTYQHIRTLELFEHEENMLRRLRLSDDQRKVLFDAYHAQFQKKPKVQYIFWNDCHDSVIRLTRDGRFVPYQAAYGTNLPSLKHDRFLHYLSIVFYQHIRFTTNVNTTFGTVALTFNAAANQVNQILGLTGDKKIPMAWKFEKPLKKAPQPLLQVDAMLGEQHEVGSVPNWVQEIQELQESGLTLSDIREHSEPVIRALYSTRSEAIRKEDGVVILHRDHKNTHICFEYELPQMLLQIQRDLDNGHCRFSPVRDGKLIFCHLSKPPLNTKHGRSSLNRVSANEGDIFIQCPCIDYPTPGSTNGAERCHMHFNLSSEHTYTQFKGILGRAPPECHQLCSKLLMTIDDLRVQKLPGAHRILSVCPHCQESNRNEEALRNSHGYNTHFRHPSHVTCNSCHKDYCTDCKEDHPGMICDGFNPKLSEEQHLIGMGFRKCPSCQTPVERQDGCAFMTCAACKHFFCWNCRCIRHEEYAEEDRAHYCLLDGSFQSNADWRNDNRVHVYNMMHRPLPRPLS